MCSVHIVLLGCVCACMFGRRAAKEDRMWEQVDEHFGDEMITEIPTIWCIRNWFSAIDGF